MDPYIQYLSFLSGTNEGGWVDCCLLTGWVCLFACDEERDFEWTEGILGRG